MNYNKKDLENAILMIARKYKLENIYSILLKNKGIYDSVEQLLKTMFLYQFDYRGAGDKEYESYKLIHSYYKTISEDGEVNFV